VKAADRFFEALAGVVDPEAKRKIIGELFIRIFEEVAATWSSRAPTAMSGRRCRGRRAVGLPGPGHPLPRRHRSGSDSAATIKSHHNVGGLPDDLAFDLVEPLRLLFKDEVRAVGEELGLPHDIVWRQPFPGPGWPCASWARSRRSGPRSCGRRRHRGRGGAAGRPLPRSLAELRRPAAVRTVGVMGDGRTYAYPIVIRAVTSDDAMTADWARLPYDLLERISSRIINEVEGVNRVALDITSKLPAPSSGNDRLGRRRRLGRGGPAGVRTGPARDGFRRVGVDELVEGLTEPQRAAVVHRGGPCSSWPGPGRARPGCSPDASPT